MHTYAHIDSKRGDTHTHKDQTNENKIMFERKRRVMVVEVRIAKNI